MDISSTRRNYMLESHRRDRLIEWMREILNHGFVLNAPQTYEDSFLFFEELINEHLANPTNSRLKNFIPSIGKFHTSLALRDAWRKYDSKYAVSQRRNINPSFNELRHILNLAQVMSIGENLQLISFDGDQTLYTDGANFEENEELSKGIIALLKAKVNVAVITAAGYGYDGTKYAYRLKGLLDSFISHKLTETQISQFFVFGGECNYLMQAHLADDEAGESIVNLIQFFIPEDIKLPTKFNPQAWDKTDINMILDVAEKSIRSSVNELRLRAKVLRKDRAVGLFPGGDDMAMVFPKGHGSQKLKSEALDEVVLRVMEDLREFNNRHNAESERNQDLIAFGRMSLSPTPNHLESVDSAKSLRHPIPFCAFNGGRDAWVDIGNKGVAVGVLQHILKLEPSECLHVGDQFLSAGNDLAARDTCPTIWITSPRETEKILEHIMKCKLGLTKIRSNSTASDIPLPLPVSQKGLPGTPIVFNPRIKDAKPMFDIYGGSTVTKSDNGSI